MVLCKISSIFALKLLNVRKMYFDSKIIGKHGLPWTDSRSDWEKWSDEYFEKLEELAQQVDDVSADASFISQLAPEDFDNGYQFVLGKIKELKEYIIRDAVLKTDDYKEMLLDSLEDIHENLLELRFDVGLYDNSGDIDCDDNDDDYDDDYDDDDYDDDDDDDYDGGYDLYFHSDW